MSSELYRVYSLRRNESHDSCVCDYFFLPENVFSPVRAIVAYDVCAWNRFYSRYHHQVSRFIVFIISSIDNVVFTRYCCYIEVYYRTTVVHARPLVVLRTYVFTLNVKMFDNSIKSIKVQTRLQYKLISLLKKDSRPKIYDRTCEPDYYYYY